MIRVIALFLVLVLAGCAGPYTRVEKSAYTAPDGTYRAEFPVGWVQAELPQEKNTLKISRDGYTLQTIDIFHAELSKAFETTKKAVTADMLPSEIAESQLAELKAKHANPASIEIISNTLSKVDGKPVFRLHLKYLNQKGLRFEEVIYGLAMNKYYYSVSYTAPTLYYFKRDLPAFEKVVQSMHFQS